MHSRTPIAVTAAALVVAVGAGAWWSASRPEERPGPLRTVFVGDSITWADSLAVERTPGEGSWVRWAVTDPRSPWAFEANVAVPGQTLGQMEERFARDVIARRPQAVVIMGGTNDVLSQLPTDVSVESLRRMVQAARDAGARVWVIGPPPVSAAYLRPVAPLAAAEEQVAAETGATYVALGPDQRQGLVGPTGEWLDGLTYDGVHPTPAGARALAEAILAAVD